MIFDHEGDKEEFIQVASVAALIGLCAASVGERGWLEVNVVARDARDVAVKLADELDVLPEPDMGDLFDEPKS